MAVIVEPRTRPDPEPLESSPSVIANGDDRVRIAHVPALDGLRGAAVAAVVAFHLGFTRGGYLGVDLFFTLSGYLITALLVAEWRTRGRVDLKRFWVRRARRLIPAFLLVLVAIAGATRIWASTTQFTQIRLDSYAALAYVANWRSVAAGTDYWTLFARPSPLQHTWSLAIEEQFYVVWPLITAAALVWRGRRRRSTTDATAGPPSEAEVRHRLDRYLVLALGGAVASAVVALVRYGGPDDANRVYFGTDTRAAAILMGAAFAIASARFGPLGTGVRTRRALDAGSVVAAIALGWAWLYLPGTDPRLYRGGLLLCGVAAVVILAAITQPRPGTVATVLSFPPLRWLGLISYGLYLWHWPVITFFTPLRTGWFGTRLLLARLGLSLGLTLASYWLLERPIRHGLGRGWAIRLATPVAVVAAIALVGWSTEGASPPVGERGGGRNRLTIAKGPIPPVVAGRPRVLVVGDSGAMVLRSSLLTVAAARQVDLVDRGTTACGIVPGDGRSKRPDGGVLTDPPRCDEWPTRWAENVGAVRPDIALIFTVAPAGSSRWIEGQWRDDCDPVFQRSLRAAYTKASSILRADGATVAYSTVGYVESASDADGRYPLVDCRNNAIRAAARTDGATLIDMAHYTCGDEGRCRQKVTSRSGDEVELRPDGLHYSGPGGVVATRYVFDQLGLKTPEN